MNKTRSSTRFIVLALLVPLVSAILLTMGQHSALGKGKIVVRSLAPVGTPTVAEKSAVFNRIWTLFEENYPDFQEKVIDWNKEKSIYQTKAMAEYTWSSFFQVVQNMISTLHDVHCGLIGAPLPQKYGPFLFTEVYANQVVVMAAPKNSTIQPGMIVLGINRKQLTDLLESSDSDWFQPLQDHVQSLFETPKDSPESITIENPTSYVVQTVQLPVFKEQKLIQLWSAFSAKNPGYMYDPKFQTMLFEMQSISSQIKSLSSPGNVVFHQLGNGILYIHIPVMTDTLQSQLQTHMKDILNAKGLIIDLRDNPGGDSQPGTWLAEHMYEQSETPLLERTYQDGSFSNWNPEVLPPIEPHIAAPTAVLIDSGDVSSAEMFIAQLNSAHNVRTFGSRTMGADGNPKIYPVMKGVAARISSWQEIVTATGQPIEQVGIAPDQPIVWSMPQTERYIRSLEENADQYKADPVVQAAEGWILSR